MSSAFRSARSVRTQGRRHSAPQRRRKGIKALSHSLAVLLISVVIVSTAMIGAAWALAATMQARSDIRSTAGYTAPFLTVEQGVARYCAALAAAG